MLLAVVQPDDSRLYGKQTSGWLNHADTRKATGMSIMSTHASRSSTMDGQTENLGRFGGWIQRRAGRHWQRRGESGGSRPDPTEDAICRPTVTPLCAPRGARLRSACPNGDGLRKARRPSPRGLALAALTVLVALVTTRRPALIILVALVATT